MTASVLFVGESPPAGAPLDFRPFDCASGTRLATIMLGLRDRATLLEHVPRANIYDAPTGAKGCDAAWDPNIARARGQDLMYNRAWCGDRVIVALGRRTAEALGMPDALRMSSYNWAPPIGAMWRPYVTDVGDHATVIYAPHPSGASSTLNDLAIRADVRATLMPELVIGCPSLRPWHFRLDDPSTLAALSAAVAPLCPALGAAALLRAEGMHRARVARVSMPLLAAVCADLNAGPEGQHATYNPMPLKWDESLRFMARQLLAHDGARTLADRWSLPTATLAKEAKAHAAINATQPRSAIRATLSRYAAAGLA